jgi:hypothetical protein
MKLLFMLGVTFIESNLRKANKRFSAIQARETGSVVIPSLREHGPAQSANRILQIESLLARARFRYTCELIYPC